MSYATIDGKRVRATVRMIGVIAKLTPHLLGAAALSATGGITTGLMVMMVRLPDEVLLQRAMEFTTDECSPPTALGARDLYLVAMAFGVVMLLCGLASIRNWWWKLEYGLTDAPYI